MTVEENIGLGLKLKQIQKETKVKEMIEAFHLQGVEKKYPNQISGGQQQRVALARSIIYNPDVLMLDEPFSALDCHLKDQLQEGVLELLELYNGEVLMVSHSKDEIYRFCKKLLIVHKGKSVLFGDTKDIFKHPQSHKVARITGCKNISKCDILSLSSVYARDWGITLEVGDRIPNDIKYIGIQAHEFEVFDNTKGETKTNVIKCEISRIVEGVNEYSIYFKSIESKNVNSNREMLYTVKKEEWNYRKDKESLYIRIPTESILLLN